MLDCFCRLFFFFFKVESDNVWPKNERQFESQNSDMGMNDVKPNLTVIPYIKKGWDLWIETNVQNL